MLILRRYCAELGVAVVTDSNVAELHLAALRTGLSAANIEMVALTLPAGERTKNWQVLGQTVEWLLDQKIERNDNCDCAWWRCDW